MNRRNIESWIPIAMNNIESMLMNSNNGKVPKVYDSYIAAFGPSVITAGLCQTVSFYDSDEKKKKITRLFKSMLEEKKKMDLHSYNSLSTYLRERSEEDLRKMKHEILEIAIACKLAIRTYSLDDEEKD